MATRNCPVCGSANVRKAPRALYDHYDLLLRPPRLCNACGAVFDPPEWRRIVAAVCIVCTGGVVVIAGYELVRDIASVTFKLSTAIAGCAGLSAGYCLRVALGLWTRRGPIVLTRGRQGNDGLSKRGLQERQ
jgi:hypothetical protein